MPVMAKRGRPPKKEGGSRNGAPLNVWIRVGIIRQLEAYLASLRPKPTKTEVVEVALEDFLKSHGFWPPADVAEPE